MPTVTLSPEADVSTLSTGEGAGAGPHLPIGYWSGLRFRSAMRFAAPAGFAGWTSVDSATLSFYTSDHYHVGVVNASVYVRRGSGALWTKAQGSTNCDSGFSSGNTTGYSDIGTTATGQVTLSMGTAENAKKTVTVTGLVQYMQVNGLSKLVFVLDPVDSSDYAEIWSMEKSGKVASLVINYTVQSPPNAPTGMLPANNAVVDSQTPTLSWVHNDPQGDPQVGADIEFTDPLGSGTVTYHPVNPTDQSIVIPYALTRGSTIFYTWRARTYDAGGAGTWSATQQFSVRPNPVVTIVATRAMAFDAVNHQPRLVVSWSADQPQASYRVQTASGYDSGVISGPATTHTIARNLVNGTAEAVTVTVVSTYGETGAATQSFTPRWGLTVHRRDLGSAPVGWLVPTIVSTVPTGASLVIEYGSAATAVAAPTSAWLTDLSAVPVARYLFWRAWFIPSATAGPTLDTITIPANLAVTLLDKWGTTRDVEALVAPWVVDTGTAVYGTRSIRADVSGAGPFKCYAFAVKLRAGRSYILTGLMKSQGNSGARFQLEDSAGTVLTGGGMSLPVGPVQSAQLTSTIDWYSASARDTNRYRTPVYIAAADMTVYVVLYAGGTAGAQAWFDAIKLEESTVATPWSPGAIGATIIDAGGVQIDGNKGGVFRYKGIAGGARDTVEGGNQGLLFGADTELRSPATGVLWVNGLPVSMTQSGTVFPASPTVGQRFFRTDIGLEFYWDGTRWLSTQLFEQPSGGWRNLQPISASAAGNNWMPWDLKGGSDIWVVSVEAAILINTGGSALSASHSWAIQFIKGQDGSGTSTLVGTVMFNSGASGVNRKGSTAIGALLNAGTPQANSSINVAMVGSPGTLYWGGKWIYRVVAV